MAGAPDRLRRIDQGIADADLLAVSLRVMAPDLRAPAGFWQLYEDTENPGTYVRVNGATYAVMPYTEYALDKDDNIITRIPAGTVFYLGGLPEPIIEPNDDPSAPRGVSRPRGMTIRRAIPAQDILLARLAAPAGVRAIDDEIARASAQRQMGTRAIEPPTGTGDLSDEAVRSARLQEIAVRALKGE